MSTVSPHAFLSLSCLPSLLSSSPLLSQELGEQENQQHLAQPDPFRGSPTLHTVVLGRQQHPPSVPASLCAVQWGLRWNELSWGQPVGDAKGQDAGREDVQQSIRELFCGNALGQVSLVLRKCQTSQRGDWKLSHYPGKRQQLHTCVSTSPALAAPGRATCVAEHPVARPHWPKDKNY